MALSTNWLAIESWFLILITMTRPLFIKAGQYYWNLTNPDPATTIAVSTSLCVQVVSGTICAALKWAMTCMIQIILKLFLRTTLRPLATMNMHCTEDGALLPCSVSSKWHCIQAHCRIPEIWNRRARQKLSNRYITSLFQTTNLFSFTIYFSNCIFPCISEQADDCSTSDCAWENQ